MLRTIKNVFQLRRLKAVDIIVNPSIYWKPAGAFSLTYPLFYSWEDSDKSLRLFYEEESVDDTILIISIARYGMLN